MAESTEVSAEQAELSLVFNDSSETMLILGIHSLAPHLQKKLKTEVQNLVNKIREENQAWLDKKEPTNPGCADEEGEKPEEAHVDTQSGDPAKNPGKTQKFQSAFQPTKGSRPLQ